MRLFCSKIQPSFRSQAFSQLLRRGFLGAVVILVVLPQVSLAGESPNRQATSGSSKTKNTRTKMTRRQAALLRQVDISRWDADKGLLRLIGHFPSGKGNAAAHYVKLEALYNKEKIKDSKFTIKRVPLNAQGLREIFIATQMRDCHLTPEYYPYMEKGTDQQPDIATYEAYALGLLAYAKALEKRQRPNEASRVYKRGLIWGWHLTQDRPNLVTFMLGLSIKLRMATAYSSFLQRYLQGEKASAAFDYAVYIQKLRRRVFNKARFEIGDFSNFNCVYSAMKVARSDQDAMWRQEAVLRLGVLRHGAPEPDLKSKVTDKEIQREVEGTLLWVSENDKKPWVRKLAIWAVQNLDEKKFADMQRKTLSMESENAQDIPLKANPEKGEKKGGVVEKVK